VQTQAEACGYMALSFDCNLVYVPETRRQAFKEDVMEPKKTLVCTCENCGNEAEMTIKCEEVAVTEKAAAPAAPPASGKHTLVCTQCGNEAEMVVDL
jgi:hypothetical protein